MNAKKWVGRITTTMVTFAMTASAIGKLAGVAKMVDELKHIGIPEEAIVPIAILELTCLVLFLVPRTRLVGLLLVTGYFGGATLAHVVGRQSIVPPLLIGFWAWVSAYIRMPELQKLLPLVHSVDAHSAAVRPAEAR